jgi:hypothetical protein
MVVLFFKGEDQGDHIGFVHRFFDKLGFDVFPWSLDSFCPRDLSFGAKELEGVDPLYVNSGRVLILVLS